LELDAVRIVLCHTIGGGGFRRSSCSKIETGMVIVVKY
jgi:hypothetical protein